MKRNMIVTICALCLALALAGCAAPTAINPVDTAALEAKLDEMTDKLDDLEDRMETMKEQPADKGEQPAPEMPAEEARIEPDKKNEPAPAADASVTATGGAAKAMADYGLDALAADAALVIQKVAAVAPGANVSENHAICIELDRKLEDMEDRFDRCEDEAERDYRQGLLSRADLKKVERELDRLERELDRAEDEMEIRFGLD